MSPLVTFVISSTNKSIYQLMPVLDSIWKQEGGGRYEIVLAASNFSDLSTDTLKRISKFIFLPGYHIFSLRAEAINQVTTPWLVLLEDHTTLKGDWLKTLLSIIDVFTDRKIIVSALQNPTHHSIADRNNFLFHLGAYLPSLRAVDLHRVPIIAGVCFQRDLIQTHQPLKAGYVEQFILPGAYKEGWSHFEPTLIINHSQSNGYFGTLAKHYYNARIHGAYTVKYNGYKSSALRHFKKSVFVLKYYVHQWCFSKYRIIWQENQGNLFYLLLISLMVAVGRFMGHTFGEGKAGYKLD